MWTEALEASTILPSSSAVVQLSSPPWGQLAEGFDFENSTFDSRCPNWLKLPVVSAADVVVEAAVVRAQPAAASVVELDSVAAVLAAERIAIAVAAARTAIAVETCSDRP